MEFDEVTTAIGFIILVVLLLGGTWSSPMSQDTKLMVSVGQVLFLLIALVVGVKHGEFRAS